MTKELRPVESPLFWKNRLEEVKEQKLPIHMAVYHVTEESWQEVNKHTKDILHFYIQKENPLYILDAGCGMGHLYECLPDYITGYMGIDISPDFITIAKQKYKRRNFRVADMRKLPFIDKEFQYAVCRSVLGMLDDFTEEGSEGVLSELKRVANKVIVIDYNDKELQEGRINLIHRLI